MQRFIGRIRQAVDLPLQICLSLLQGQTVHMQILPLDGQKPQLRVQHHLVLIKYNNIFHTSQHHTASVLQRQFVTAHLDLLFHRHIWTSPHTHDGLQLLRTRFSYTVLLYADRLTDIQTFPLRLPCGWSPVHWLPAPSRICCQMRFRSRHQPLPQHWLWLLCH